MPTDGGEMTRRSVFRITAALGAVVLGCSSRAAQIQQISSDAGLRVIVSSTGVYQVSAADYGWMFAGSVSQLQNLVSNQGADSLGNWVELAFNHDSGRSSAIRLYDAIPVVVFSTTYGSAGPNSGAFPHLTTRPAGLSMFSYTGLWSYGFGRSDNHSPLLFYDSQANAFVFSAASNFMTAVSQVTSDGAIESAIDSQIGSLPSGFKHTSILAFGRGVNKTFQTWGSVLTGLSGKQRPANDAIPLLNKLSYWTDAAAAYYYHPQDPTQYMPTLLKMPAAFSNSGTPFGSMELDSWYYPKGSPASWTQNGFGMATFQADAALFPKGLAAFQQNLGVPLITHARWIDQTSPLRNVYKVSGNVAIDPQYWKDYAAYMAASGVDTLEQDWLDQRAATAFNLTDPYLFLDNMASALGAAGRSIVYCMPLSTHIMQSSNYNNVVAVRVSPDGFIRDRWDTLLFDSAIAGAVGLWPFADNLRSPNEKDVLLSTLTAGPLGIGDAYGETDFTHLKKAVRADGVIVKPDAPILPVDASWVSIPKSNTAPMVASTYTDHAGLRTAYVFAYERTSGALAPVAFTPESVGVTGPAYVYDFFKQKGSLVAAGAPFTDTVDYNASFYIVAPIGKSGMAFLGDSGKYIGTGKKRIAALSDDGALHVVVRFAVPETEVALQLYSTAKPFVEGVGRHRAHVTHEGNGLYRVAVSSAAGGSVSLTIRTE